MQNMGDHFLRLQPKHVGCGASASAPQCFKPIKPVSVRPNKPQACLGDVVLPVVLQEQLCRTMMKDADSEEEPVKESN